MIVTPAIIALMSGLLLAVVMTVYASLIGVRILRSWDIGSGSEEQLALERKTYLISTVLAYVMAFELFSLFLFVYTVDNMSTLFVGAMCAAGTLNVNSYGYSTLMVKTAVFVLCGLWLILNYTDNRGYDYPLIRKKYRFLMVITALILIEAYLMFRYFSGMEPNLITSCCGALFSERSGGAGSEIAGLSPVPTMVVFFLSALLAIRVGIHFYWTGRAAALFSALSAWLMIVSLISIVSFISVYYYELPTHHCPFCILHSEYHRVGYALYLSLFCAGIAGVGTGMIDGFKNIPSLKDAVPTIQKNLCAASMIGYIIFCALAAYPILFSGFKPGA